jgi:hypothetical protein
MTLGNINQAFASLERFNLIVDAMIINSERHADIRNFGRTVVDEFSKEEMIERQKPHTSARARLFTADVYMCNHIPSDRMYLFDKDSQCMWDFLLPLYQ